MKFNNKGYMGIQLALMLFIIPIATIVGVRTYYSVQRSAQIQHSTMSKSQMNSIKNWLMSTANDADSDGFVELLKESTGNTLPVSIPMKGTDDYGNAFKYYTWDLGAVNGNATYSQNVTAPPIAGLVGRIISAGKDVIFQTNASSTTAQGDDIVIEIYNSDVLNNTNSSGWIEDVANNKVTLKNNGRNVGIGESNPNEHLEVASATARAIISDGGGANRRGLLLVGPTAGSDVGRVEAYGYGVSGGGKVLALNSVGGGNVGVGTATPGFKLDVNGDIGSYGWFRNWNSGQGLYSQANGNHIYSTNGNYWRMTGAGQNSGGLIFFQQYESNQRGFVYWDTNSFGLLNSAGGWSYRVMNGGGSDTTYGAATIWGSKNGWGGLAFRDGSSNLLGTLMMTANNSGFFNSSDNGWRWYVDNAGNQVNMGSLTFTQANPTISASSYFIAPGGAYFNSGKVYAEAAIEARGGLHDDTGAYLELKGGTTGKTALSGALRFPDGTEQTTAADSSVGNFNGYTLKINGYSELFRGMGSYNSATGKFSGQIVYNGLGSGQSGQVWCGSDPYCAWYSANYYYAGGGGGYGRSYVVGVSALPVNSVTQIW